MSIALYSKEQQGAMKVEKSEQAGLTGAQVEPALVSVVCHFATTDDDKDSDTVVSVALSNANGTLIAAGDVGGGWGWPDGSQIDVGLPVVNAVPYSSCARGTLSLTEHPNGDDEWHFNLTVTLNFQGGAWWRITWNGFNVDSDRAQVVSTWA